MASAELSREENVYMAKLAEQAERYEEMVEYMEKVAKTVDSEEQGFQVGKSSRQGNDLVTSR
jgi:hypothetical protein